MSLMLVYLRLSVIGISLGILESLRLTLRTLYALRFVITNTTSFYPKVVTSLENRFAALCSFSYGLSTNSGSSAADIFFHGHMELYGKGDVLVLASTIPSSFAVARHHGFRIVGLPTNEHKTDYDLEVLQLRVASKAPILLVLVYQYGINPNLTEHIRIAREFGYKIVVDLSHAHGAHVPMDYQDVIVAAYLSLQGSKAVAAGEGGIFVTSDAVRMSIAYA